MWHMLNPGRTVCFYVRMMSMLESLKNQPLNPETFPPMAQKAVAVDTPKPMKMMAAKGALPLPPETLVLVWYQLSFDTDEEIRAAVSDTVAHFDEKLLADIASRDLPASVLDWLSKSTAENAILEKIILNPKTEDATLMDLAASAARDLVDLIANNQVRILRAPEIIEKIYLNPASRMATVDKLVAFAKEHQIAVPALRDAIQASEIPNDVEGLPDEEFEEFLQQSAAESKAEAAEAEAGQQPPTHAPTGETQETSPRRKTRAQIIEKLNASQRIRVALTGSREDRNILLRDTRRVVYMSVMKSPQISLAEVTAIASSKNMPDEVISYVAGRRDWVRYYPIVVALVNNPKCPLADAVGFMRQLRLNDLKLLQKSKSIPAQLARQAQMLYKQKATKG